jgi:alpha/beta superfamily hydrolase
VNSFRVRARNGGNRLQSMMEPHQFTRGAGNLFGLHFAASGTPAGFALVFCNAFGKEFEICRTQVSQFCRALAARGVGAYRFDYYGYGDSDGEFEEASFSTMCCDLEAAVGEAKRRCGVEKVVLAGIRFGALVAEAVASRRADIAGLIMWAPTLAPWDYFYDGLRQTVCMQTTLFREVRITRDEIVENVLAGRPSRVGEYDLSCTDEGFRLGAAIVRDFRDLSPSKIAAGLRARTLLIHVSKRAEPVPREVAEHAAVLAGRGVQCDVDTAVELTLPWLHENVFAATSPHLFGKTFRWLGV